MDKETLSNYGWIVICVLVLAVMLALATPFGTFVADGFKATYTGLFQTGDNAMDTALGAVGVSNKLPCGHGRKEAGDHSQKECGHYNCQDTDCGCVPASCGCENHWSGDGKEHGVAVTSKNCYSGHRYTCECTAGWTVPDGGEYMIVSTGTRYNAGAQLPCGYEPKTSDAYDFGDYIYRYNRYNGGSTSWPVDESLNGWGVAVADKTKASYGEILETVCGKPVTTMKNAFRQCYQLIKAPTIPKYITDMSSAFSECYLLSEAPDLTNCKQLVDVSYAFLHCRALQNAPEIPEGVLNMFRTFGYSGITGVVIINATPSEYAECFTSVDMTNITLTGSTSKDVLNLIGATGRNWTPIE